MKNKKTKGQKKGADVVFLVCLLLFFFCTAFDLVTKAWAEYYFEVCGNAEIELIPHFMTLTHTYNTGAAWGMMADNPVLMKIITWVTPLIVLLLLFFAWKLPRHYNVCRVLLGVVAAGAFANFVDRAFSPAGVRDFMDVSSIGFGVCNFADYFLSIGGVVLVICFIVCTVTDREDGETDETDKKEEKE